MYELGVLAALFVCFIAYEVLPYAVNMFTEKQKEDEQCY